MNEKLETMTVQLKKPSRVADFLRRLIREKPLGAFCEFIILFIFLIAVFADFIIPYGIHQAHFDAIPEGPSARFWLGTDEIGADVLSRIIWGARVTILVGLITTTLRRGNATRESLLGVANEGWHTDSSYMRLSAKASLLSAHVVPSQGGQTEFADMRAAYDALDEATKAQIANLSAYHSLFQSQARAGLVMKVGDGYGYEDKVSPLRPLVKVHPVTKRPSLYIGRHAYEIPGLEPEAGEKLLADLTTFACQPPRTYKYNWQPGDIVIWDNRCVLHRACPYDRKEPRTMLHTRIAGDPATELAINA